MSSVEVALLVVFVLSVVNACWWQAKYMKLTEDISKIWAAQKEKDDMIIMLLKKIEGANNGNV